MIVDLGHSAKQTDFVFFTMPPPRPAADLGVSTPATRSAIGFSGQTPKRVRVRWYFAPEGAKPIPGGSIWGSCDWSSVYERADATIGEVPRTGTSKGNRLGLAPIGVTGQRVCGRPVDFLEPKVWNPNAPIVRRGPSGVPACCNPALAATIAFCGKPITEGAVGLYSVLVPDNGELGLTQLDIKTPTGDVGLVAPLEPEFGHLGLTAAIDVDAVGLTGPLEAEHGGLGLDAPGGADAGELALDESAAVEIVVGGVNCTFATEVDWEVLYSTTTTSTTSYWFFIPNPCDFGMPTATLHFEAFDLTDEWIWAVAGGECPDGVTPIDNVTSDGMTDIFISLGDSGLWLVLIPGNDTLTTRFRVSFSPV